MKVFEYQKWGRFFAQVAGGMEALGSIELERLGAKNCKPLYRGVSFEADMETLYSINYQSRLVSRVLAPLLRFDCHSTKYLYKTAKRIEWSQLLSPQKSFAIFSTVSNSNIRHSQYAALCLKDACVDFFKENFSQRPNVDTSNPSIWINLHIENNRAVISVDTSGGALHRRGYRQQSCAAPMQETLAAAILENIAWNGQKQLYDPLCGSGTLLCEAAYRFCKIPSAFLRQSFGFEQLPDFDFHAWHACKRKYSDQILPLPPHMIRGSDISDKAVEASQGNCHSFPYGDTIEIEKKDIFALRDRLDNHYIITNPPYGKRMGTEKEAKEIYKFMGAYFRDKCRNSTMAVYLGNPEAVSYFGYTPQRSVELINGAIKGRLFIFVSQ